MTSATPADASVPSSGTPRTATLVLALTDADARYLVGRALRNDLPPLLNADDLALLFAPRDGVPLNTDALRKKLKRLGVPVAQVGAQGGPLVDRDELLAAVRRAARAPRRREPRACPRARDDALQCANCLAFVGSRVGGALQDDRPLCETCATSLDDERGPGGGR